MKALVVFCNGEHPLTWLLKTGFGHCFVCVENNGLWLKIDDHHGVPDIRYLTVADEFDLAGFYRNEGFTAVETFQRDLALTVPLALRNCVGMVKSILCIRSWAVTPYSLYKYLRGEVIHE